MHSPANTLKKLPSIQVTVRINRVAKNALQANRWFSLLYHKIAGIKLAALQSVKELIFKNCF
jgi:hypothetical protein